MAGVPLHQTLELHELLSFKTVCAAKAAAMSGLVKDGTLRALLADDVTRSQAHIRELQGLLQG